MQGENKITCTSSSVPRFLSPLKTKELFEDARVKVTVPTDLRLVQLAGADAITVLDLLRIVMGHLRQQALHKNGAWPVALANSGRTNEPPCLMMKLLRPSPQPVHLSTI